MSTPTLILDCDGVLADTERDGHLVAFNMMFEELGVPLHWDDETYAELLLVGGGKERLMKFLTPELAESLGMQSDEKNRRDVVAHWHSVKTRIFRELVGRGDVPPRPGVARLIKQALGAGWKVAVASTSARESVSSVLDSVVGPEVAGEVRIFAGDIVAHKKPAPDIYLLALRELGSDPMATIVIEDSGVGCRSGVAAELAVVVTVSGYTSGDDFSGAVLVVTDLGEPEEAARVLADPLHRVAQKDVTVDVDLLGEILASPR